MRLKDGFPIDMLSTGKQYSEIRLKAHSKTTRPFFILAHREKHIQEYIQSHLTFNKKAKRTERMKKKMCIESRGRRHTRYFYLCTVAKETRVSALRRKIDTLEN